MGKMETRNKIATLTLATTVGGVGIWKGLHEATHTDPITLRGRLTDDPIYTSVSQNIFGVNNYRISAEVNVDPSIHRTNNKANFDPNESYDVSVYLNVGSDLPPLERGDQITFELGDHGFYRSGKTEDGEWITHLSNGGDGKLLRFWKQDIVKRWNEE